MPLSLAPIPLEVPIVDPDTGAITTFYRERWQQLIDGALQTPRREALPLAVSTAALPTTIVLTTPQGGIFRLTAYVQKTIADGVSSSLTVTFGWTSNGVPCTRTFAALATDVAGANDSVTWMFPADVNSDITAAIAYASNTPAGMAWLGDLSLEQMG